MVVAGWNEGQLETKVTAPLKELFFTVQNALKPSPMPPEPSPFQYSSSSEATPEAITRGAPEATHSVVYFTPIPTKVSVIPTQNVHYVYPTTVYPTVAPGAPGSKEWNDAFWKRWEEMGQHNSEMQHQVEEAQKTFCENNPSICR